MSRTPSPSSTVVSAEIVEPALLIYRVDNGHAQPIEAIRDNGHPLKLFGEVADRAMLTRLDVPAGYYAACGAAGLIRLGCPPVGVVSVELRVAQ